MKTLSALCDFLRLEVSGVADHSVTRLTIDSRQVDVGTVFVALPGASCHGMTFAGQAEQAGASAILTDAAGLADFDVSGLKCPVYSVPNLQNRLPDLAKWFYDDPSRRVKIIGITGTNGKTSTSHYIGQLLQSAGYKVALMGTLGNGLIGDLQPSRNTTLEVLVLNEWLARFAEQQVDYVVMEVSSHAVSLNRIAGLQFDVVALTQVTRDHLDFHGSEAEYRAAKKQLFEAYPSRCQVLNLEDETGADLAEKAHQTILTYAQVASNADVRLQSVSFQSTGLKGRLQLPVGACDFDLPLMGGFNVENLLCAVSCVWCCGLDSGDIQKAVTHLRAVPGRMEVLTRPNQPTVVIDYAHTPDALQAVLAAVGQHLPTGENDLWVVFGCGGDRDKGKRPLMGQVAAQLSGHVILTDDNPRSESPEAIVADIQAGFDKPADVIHDREQAIATAIQQAGPQAVVVVAGKGHEDYQEINGQRWPMSDQGAVEKAFQSLSRQGEA
ncbi:MAG: UDP-N-acetylmuramoyl-L-alanyl-D-glutamate--2,6-diaminopimelate ligase [Hydrogenovibrio sp.]